MVVKAEATDERDGCSGEPQDAGMVHRAPAQAIVEVRSPAYLFLVDELIHDQFFDLGDISYDRVRQTVTIPFERDEPEKQKPRSGGRCLSLAPSVLRIMSVKALDLHDTAKIQRYDFNMLQYSAEAGTLNVVTCLPLDLKMTVGELCVEVEVTESQLRGASPPVPGIGCLSLLLRAIRS